MTSAFGTTYGGDIDRSRAIAFTFDGKTFHGRSGDTLAAALMADDVRLLGRGFKYHRPRGLLGAGVEEPNALVGVGVGGRFEPNTRATDVFLYEGLTAVSQNRWPSLAFDLGALNQAIARFIPAGFYYKTFFGGGTWKRVEPFIRAAAGLGRPPTAGDTDTFLHRAAFCDVLVVGSGPAGLAAADAAARAGARVFLVEQDALAGGALLRDPAEIDGFPGEQWAADVGGRVRSGGGRVLTRTTASGFHDHGLVALIQRHAEPGEPPPPGFPAQTRWALRARRVVLAQGSIERPLLFSGNDRPGVMLASAARTYAQRFRARPGRRAVIAGCDDHVYLTASSLAAAGVEIAAIVDSRDTGDQRDAQRAFPIHRGSQIVSTVGGRALRAAVIATPAGELRIACDLIAMSGGQTPVVHLHMQAGGGLAWDASAGAFTPIGPRQNQDSAGAGAGRHGLAVALADGWRAGGDAVEALGLAKAGGAPPAGRSDRPAPAAAGSPPGLHASANAKTAFVDFQNDVTAADIDLAWREGYRSVEHLKRYTTLGMATDQGKTSNLVGMTRMAEAQSRTPPDVGLTTFRPPYTPVTLGALAGLAVGDHVAPRRRLPLHDAHLAENAFWQPSGYWSRPRSYRQAGEDHAKAALREARAVRLAVGMVDVSTLAKFDVSGPDAGQFLELICATSVARLKVGRGRYTVMLREDGVVADDGTVWRLGKNRFLMTSSTGGAEVMAHRLSYARHVLAPALRVTITPLQEAWAAIALAGPLARSLMTEIAEGIEPPPHMSSAAAAIAGERVLILGASYSGERAFEVYVSSFAAAPVWSALLAGCRARGGGPYGLDAMDLLRIEKGHVVVGAEIDGRVSPHDLGMATLLRANGFIGYGALQRPDFRRLDRLRLVGLEGVEGALPEGAMLTDRPGARPSGHVTSAGVRTLCDGAIGLGLLHGGLDRRGEIIEVTSPTRGLRGRVRVVEPLFHDPEGDRYRD